jgi:hypothetical protein
MTTSFAPLPLSRYWQVVTTPGKFEGCAPVVPYLWDLAMEGDGEPFFSEKDQYTEFRLFQIDAEEAESFGYPIGSWFVIWEDAVGFVHGINFQNREQVADFVEEYLA